MQRALVGMLAGRVAVLIEVREHVDLGIVLVALILVHDMNLDFAEAPRERDLGGGRQVHIAEQDQLVIEKRLVHLAEDAPVYGLGEAHAGDLNPEA